MSLPRTKLFPLAVLAIFIGGILLSARYVAQSLSTDRASGASAATPVATTITAHPQASKVDSVDVMAERLRARLESAPNDMNGWVLLARSYHYLERWDDAKYAFAKARALGYEGEEATAAPAADTPPAESANAVFDAIGHLSDPSAAQERTP